jgi:hypothetical protein
MAAMRTLPRIWDFTENSMVLSICLYNPISETQAEIAGTGKVWDDRVCKGDSLLIKVKGGKGILVVDKIEFTSDSAWFTALVTLGEKIEDETILQ